VGVGGGGGGAKGTEVNIKWILRRTQYDIKDKLIKLEESKTVEHNT